MAVGLPTATRNALARWADAGGKDASRLDAALAAAYDLIGAAGQ